jgi:outer membrane autotransporter protein
MAISGTLGLSSSSGNTGVSVGGAGGNGGASSTVTVNNYSSISTAGMDSIGIFAQSVGGSGGNGGMALTAQLTGATQDTATVGVAIGGGGGNGNSAGEVDVTNTATGTINTSGFGGHGIQAQSVGGGGGNGGMALVAQVGVSGTVDEETKTLNVGVAVGGAGGDGGFGNTVHVVNNGTINVTGDTSMGIFAQSVGGGGGNGGGAVSAFGMLTDSSNTSQRSLNINVAIGGAGGNGNYGGAVIVENTGSITTHGASGYGVFAQSVGGGGGIGGRANTFSLVVTNACTICDEAPEFNNFFSLGAAIGGNGGGASKGGAVTITNTGRIETFGDASDGIYAQSVGGGGGNGGNGTIGLTGVLPYGDLAPYLGTVTGVVNSLQNLQVSVGGNNGSSGDGGAVSVDNNKDIITHGAHSNAITAQSIGGGGGFGGDAADGDSGVVNIGGKGGAGGDGGDVIVTQHGGATIETFGTASYGIFAQSVGGGGGVAGNSGNLLSSVGPNIGVGLIVGQGGGSGGIGGQVDISVDGAIVTHGDNAHGIFAQSVGGGGGAMGDLGSGSNLLSWHVGSNGDAGNAGAVNVTLTGTIATSGNNAAGIFAQSAAGAGLAGNVAVTLNGSVVTGAILAAGDGTASAPLRGLGSIGILAQSLAADNANNGNITIDLNNSNGVVQGGRTQNTDLGVGIWVVDGKNNTITNQGLVTTVSGVDGGYAILATGSDSTHLGGNETVNNFGTIVGSVDLGAGANVFNNKVGALFSPGAIAYIGAGNTLFNDGTISPGGSGKAMTTALTGNFVQSNTGIYATSIDFNLVAADLINVTGTATIAGTVSVVPVNPGNAAPGSHQFTIFSSTAGTTHTGVAFVAPPSAVASYSLTYPNSSDIDVAYNVNFNPAGLPPNLYSIANAVNRIQTAGVPSFSPIAARLFALPNLQSLIGAYNALDGEGTATTQQLAFEANQMFFSSMFEQAQSWFTGNDGGFTFSEAPTGALQYAASRKKPATDAFAQLTPEPVSQPDRWHAWTSVFGTHQSVDGDAAFGTANYSASTFGGAIGVDRQVNHDFLLGFAVAGSQSTFSVPDRSTNGSVDGGHFGLYGAMRRNAWYVATSMSYAHLDNETNRTIAGVGPTEYAQGKFASDQFSIRTEVGRRNVVGTFAITPFAAVELNQLWQNSYSETSVIAGSSTPGILGLSYDSKTVTSVQSSLGAQLESRYILQNDMVLRPFARLAWVHEFEPDRQITASFNAAPGFPFQTSGAQAASDLGRVNAGFDLRVKPTASIFASFNGDFAPNTRSYGVSGGYRVGW